MKRGRTGGSRDGFSTLEAAVSLAVLALMLGTAVQSIRLSTHNIVEARNRQKQLIAMRERYGALDRAAAEPSSGPPWARFETLPGTDGSVVAVEFEAGAPKSERFLTFISKPSARE